MAHDIESMLTNVKKYFKLDTICGVNLNYTPKTSNETIDKYIESVDGTLSLRSRVSNTLRKYLVTVFYFDNNDSTIHTIDLGIHEGHTIMNELEKANFFNSTNMWFLALSTPNYKKLNSVIPSHYCHNFYMYIS